MDYLPENDPVVTTFDRLGDTFNGNEIGVIIIEAENIFTNDLLRHIDRLTEKIEKVDGLASVTSLANVMDMQDHDGALHVDRLLAEEPDSVPKNWKHLKNTF